MNVLITNISTFAYNLKEIEYEIRVPECDVETIQATHTNESILKCLSHIRQIKDTGGIQKIIALVSNAALHKRDERFEQQTAYEYVQKVAKAAFSDAVQFVEVNLENTDKQERDLHIIINDVCSEISEQDVVYMDAAGGKRTISNIMQLLTNMLAYKGIKNALTLYSDIQNTPSFITDTRAFEQMTALMNAFNEFMTTGKSDLLNQYIPSHQSPQLSKLLTTMRAFSNCIRILDIDNLDRIIQDLQTSIKDYRDNGVSDNIESVIVHQFLPIIQKKLLGDETSLDYLSIIQWCLDNALIQQALTIFESKIPKYLFDKKLIEYRSNSVRIQVEQEANKSTLHFSTEAYALYTDLLLNIATNPLMSEMMQWLHHNTKPETEAVKNAMAIIKSFDSYFKTRQQRFNLTPDEQKILDLIKNKKYKSYENFKSDISNNKKILQAILHIKEEDSSKIEAIAAIQNGKEHDRYKIHNHNLFAIILYAYAFLKQERNRINHATSEKLRDFSECEKETLSRNGFDTITSANYYSTLCKNIQFAIDAVRHAIPEQTITLETTFTPTELQSGDVVSATCSANKKVYVDSENYEIQMVIPREIKLSLNLEKLLGKRVQVKVKQISKAGKIAQVEFIQIIKQ